MSELLTKIDSIVGDGYKNQTSFFQLQYFLVGKEPTVQAKLERCKTELFSRKCDMEGTMNELEECYDLIRLQELQKSDFQGADVELNESQEIYIRQIDRKILSLKDRAGRLASNLRAKEEESNFLIGLYERLCEAEEPKDWNSLEVQAEYHNARLSKELEARLLLGVTPDAEMFKTIMALPDGMPAKTATQQLVELTKKRLKDTKQEAQQIEKKERAEEGK